MNTEQQFRDSIERYLTTAKMKPTAFGVAAMKDPNFVFAVRDGRACSIKTMDRVLAWMDANPAEEQRAAS